MNDRGQFQINPNIDRRRHILLFVLISIGIIGLVIRGITLVILGIQSVRAQDESSLVACILNAVGMLFCAGLLIPALVYTIKRLKGQKILLSSIRPIKFWQVVVLDFFWVLIVILGIVLARLFDYGWILAAPMFLLGISLPIFIMVWIALGGLPAGSRLRLWSTFGFGMVGGTMVALLLEFLLVGLAIVAIGFFFVTNPELVGVIDQIKIQVTDATSGDMQTLLAILAPYITNPFIILSVLIFTAVITPLIEEAVKPAVIWFLGKHLTSPAEGFGLGALCGAGFALLEGLMATSGASDMWWVGLAGRAAASLMHITASGIMGWGIASAQLEKRYSMLLLTYLLSVSIHGLWNAAVILAIYGSLNVLLENQQMVYLGALVAVGAIGILFLELLVLLTALPLINRKLRRSVAFISPPALSDIIPPLAISNSRENDGLDPEIN